ncbi:DinB family protein [Bacillus taeanensis]|uniref:DinB family protein n=1 Tax=Bacillus taeanensis TaxID=273032 RepID=A0A366Y3T0_9BACI|nr:DinB family protein [Bacillus taeanensis]RBW71063.1 hypothetical protein DS031_03460 [Bacillus taeanensis]
MVEKTLGNYDIHDAVHLLQGLKETREQLLSVLSSLSTEQLHEKLTNMPSVGQLLMHLIEYERAWLKAIHTDQDQKDISAEFDYKEDDTVKGFQKSWFLARLAETREQTRNYFYKLSDIEFRRPTFQIRKEEEVLRYSPEWIVYHLLDHESYIRGQIAIISSLILQKQIL